jgi:hypothetical protein
MYRLCYLLTHSTNASLLAGVAYLFSPYLIININIRGDFTETVAQGLLPLVLYYSFYLFNSFSLLRFLILSIVWAMLITTHLITFAYSALFILFVLGIYALQDRQYIKNLFGIILAIGVASLLTAWFLVPIVLYHNILTIHLNLPNPVLFNWLTPLATLISIKSISPIPIPSDGQLPIELYPALGLTVMMGVGISLYAYFNKANAVNINKKLLLALLITFIFVLFAAWSPVDFWQYLPDSLVIPQFTYRMLTQTMWLGTILFSFGLIWLFKEKLDARFFVIILCFLIIGNSSWMHSAKGGAGDTISAIINESNHASDHDYQIDPDALAKKQSLIATKNILNNQCHREHSTKVCNITVIKNNSLVALPAFYYPNLFTITANNKTIAYYPFLYKDKTIIGLKLDRGIYDIKIQFTGLKWANWISLFSWLAIMTLICGLIIFNLIKKRANVTDLPLNLVSVAE